MDLSLIYFPSAVLLGALHALEPGHAKTLTAAYLIGTKGTKRDATILGLSVAATHTFVVVALCLVALFLGREAFTGEASYYLALGSSLIVIALGAWLLRKRLLALKRASSQGAHTHTEHHLAGAAFKNRRSLMTPASTLSTPQIQGLKLVREKETQHHSDDHALLSDDEHARAHAAQMPSYVSRGERPTFFQIVAFGAAGGLVPCPAAISVMLLSLSLNQSGKGLLLVLGFGIGLAITLVGVGLLIVTGISRLTAGGRLSRLSTYAPVIAAVMVIISGSLGFVAAVIHQG